MIGGGLSGMSACIEAFHCGAKVTMLEKESEVGGNSAKAVTGVL